MCCFTCYIVNHYGVYYVVYCTLSKMLLRSSITICDFPNKSVVEDKLEVCRYCVFCCL